jgi:hypothetical protein
MLGTSDLMSWSLFNLAKALPRLDYITTFPKADKAAVNFTTRRFAFKDNTTARITDQLEAGLGTKIDFEKCAPFVRQRYPDTADNETEKKAVPPAPAAESVPTPAPEVKASPFSAAQSDNSPTAEALPETVAVERIHLLEHVSGSSRRAVVFVHVRGGAHVAHGAAEAILPAGGAEADAVWGALHQIAGSLVNKP